MKRFDTHRHIRINPPEVLGKVSENNSYNGFVLFKYGDVNWRVSDYGRSSEKWRRQIWHSLVPYECKLDEREIEEFKQAIECKRNQKSW